MAVGFRKPTFGGLFGSVSMAPPVQQAVSHAPVQAPMPEKPQRWLQGGKFTGRDGLALALGAIGDAFTGQSRTADMITGERQFQQQIAQEQALRERQRMQAREDKQWEWQNAPRNAEPTTFQRDYEYIRATQGDEAAKTYMQNKVNPPLWRQGPDGQFYRMDTQPQDLGESLPEGWQIDGGPSLPATGGFRY